MEYTESPRDPHGATGSYTGAPYGNPAPYQGSTRQTAGQTRSGCLKGGCLALIGIIVGTMAFLFLAVFLPVGALLSLDLDDTLDATSKPFTPKKTLIREGNENQVLAVVEVNGVISRQGDGLNSASAGKLVQILDAIRRDETVRAIVLDMDTPGGEVVAADEIYQAVIRCKKRGIPVVTCMRSLAASGGYYIACASDWIVANRMTMTGSVGVIMNGMNVKGLIDKCGIQSVVFKSGDMKDAMSPMRPMSDRERDYVQSMIDETFHEFAAVVAQGRNRYFNTPEKVKAAPFADGRVVSGMEARKLGLVDELGYFEQALAKACQLASVDGPAVVRYGVSISLTNLLWEMSGGKPMNMKLTGMPKVAVQPGKLYFLAPECIASWE